MTARHFTIVGYTDLIFGEEAAEDWHSLRYYSNTPGAWAMYIWAALGRSRWQGSWLKKRLENAAVGQVKTI